MIRVPRRCRMADFRLVGRGFLIVGCLSGIARAQRIAPLPPPCSVGGADTSRIKPRPPRRPVSLAILSLSVGAGAASYTFLSDGLTDAIAARIGGGIPGIFVLGRRAQHRRPGTTASVMRTLGADLGVSYILAGSLSRGRTNLQIALALYDATTGRPTWTRTFYYDSSGALPIEQATAIEVGSRMVGVLTPAEQQALLRVPSARHVAYEEMLRGDVAASELARSLAGDAYRRALKIDPYFADASAKLALTDADALDENDVESPADAKRLANEVQSAAERAVALDSTSATAWLAEARAWLLGGTPPAVWSRAFDRSIARDSTNAAVVAAYGLALAQSNERTRARPALERATTLDPSRADVWTTLAEIAAAERRDGDACSLLNRAILEDALYGPAWAARALLRGRHDDLRFAWADAETADRLGSTLLGQSAAAQIDLTARDTVRARERLAILWQDVRDRKSVSAHEGRAVAVALMAAGENSRALDVLEAVRPLGPRYTASLRDSSFDRLRNEPRFRALVSNRMRS